jgi:hypothetical protein
MRSIPCPLILALSAVAAAPALASAPKPPADFPPVVQRFHPDVPIDQPPRGGSGIGRSTLLQRSIDVSGIDSNTLQGQIGPASPSNTALDLLFPPGTRIRGYGYDANFTYFNNPIDPTMGFRLFNSVNAQIPPEVIAPGPSPATLTLPDFDVGNANWLSLPNGHLRVEFFEAVDDVLAPVRDGVWTSGEIRILYDTEEVTDCCIWDNGAFDNRDGALSQDAQNRALPVYHVMADDFYLEPNFVHMIEYMEAVFLAQFPAPGYAFDTPIGRLEIRTDCDGKPGELLETYDIVLPRDAFLGELTTDLGTANVYRVVAPTPGLCLTGGKPYWASFILEGVATQGGTDLWYWGTTGSPSLAPPYDPPLHVKGSLPHRQNLQGGPWERIDCATNDPNCLGCTDLNFCIQGERCKIIYDASTYKAPPQPIGQVIAQYGARSINISGISNRQARAADDVTVSPCETDLYPCVVEAYIWTTCTPATARLEIYETECADDSVQPADPALAFSITAGPEDAVDQGLTIPAASGPPFRLYCFKFKNFDGFVFQKGKTYWLSAMGTGDAGINNDAYFAFSAPRCPEDVCYRFGNEGYAKSAYTNSLYPDWTPTSLVPGLLMANDFAMLVAVRAAPPALPGLASPYCRADFDRSGHIGVSDIFSFLSEWFSGCP